jgi:fibronectin type 3 domain-containing protein
MKRRHVLIISSALLAIGLQGCDRQRSNPIDPESSRIDERPATPQGLVAESGVSRVLLSWEPVADPDLAGYAVYRAVRSDGNYEFVASGEDSTARISTGKTTYIDSVAAPGQTFFYRVAAVDTTGHISEPSGFVGATVLSDNIAPQAPQNLSAVTDESEVGRIVLRWSPPTLDADGGELTGLAGFVIFRSEVGTGGLAPIDTLGTEVREYIDEGLKALTDYSYSVMAFDDSGNESQLAASSQTRTRGLPSPTRLVATGEIGRIVLRWVATEAAELLGYNVYRSMRSDTGYVRLEGEEGTPFTTGQTSYIDSGLVAESQFFYRVEAVGRDGLISQQTGFVGATARSDEVPPTAPENLSAIPDEVNFGRVTLSWTAPVLDSDGGELTGLEGFVVLRSEGGTASFVAVDTLSAGLREYVDEGLKALTTYAYTVVAFDDAGNESGQASSVTTQTRGVEVPSGLRAAGGIGRVVLSWSAVQADGLQGYNVFRSTRSDQGYARLTGVEGTPFTTGQTTYVDSNLAGGARFFYRIVAVTESEESVQSGFVSAEVLVDEVPPATPSNLSAVPDENEFGRVSLNWSVPVTDSGGGELSGLSGYLVFRSQGGTASFVQVAQVSVAGYEDNGLEASKTYFYTVVALDGAGNQSARAASVSVRTNGPDQVPPASPGNLSAVPDETEFGRVTLSWSAPVTDADGSELTGLTGYVVLRSEGGTTSFVALDTLGTEVRTYLDVGLKALTTYAYTVVAFDGAGNESGQASSVSTQTQGVQVPRGLRAQGGIGRVVLSWTAVDVEGLQGYNVFRSTRSDQGYTRLTGVEGTPFTTGQTTYVDSSLTGGDRFFYRVVAVTASAESAQSGFVSAEVSADEVPPATPANLSAVPDETDFGHVSLNWSAPVTDSGGGELSGLTGYLVFRSLGSTASFVQVAQVNDAGFEDTGLEPSKTYFYTVVAIDASGNQSARATSVSVRTNGPDQVPPSSPANLSAVPDESNVGRVTLSWSAPVTDADGSELTGLSGFVVLRSEGSTASFVALDTLGAQTRTYVDEGLKALTTYAYTVIAFDDVGNESGQASAVATQTQGVQVPSGLAAQGGIGFVALSWTAVEVEGLQGYDLYRTTRSDQGYVRLAGVEGTPFTTGQTTYVDSNLTGGDRLFYRVVAVTAAAQSEQSGFVSAEVLLDQVPPSAPENLLAVPDETDFGQVTLNWSDPTTDSDGGDLTDLAAYIILRSKDSASAVVPIDTVDAAATQFVDSGLDAATTYFYAITAVDAIGNTSTVSSSAFATTGGISRPGSVRASSGIKQIVVTWGASSDSQLQGYNVYRSTRSDQGYSRLTGVEGTPFTTGQTTYIDSGLTGAATFFYRVSAVATDGESDQSLFVGATVQSDNRGPAAPTFVEGTPVTEDPEQLNITWKAPTTDSNGSALTGLDSYLIYRSDASDGQFTLVGNSTATSFVDTGLTAQTTYFYQVEAADSDGNVSPRSTTVSATTGGVDVPANVTLSSSTPSDAAQPPVVTVRWEASSGAILNYDVQRTTVASSTNDADYVEVGTSSLDLFREDNTVTRGLTYYYRVRARDVDNRLSDWTTPLSITVSN